jgi:hypothetical protein
MIYVLKPFWLKANNFAFVGASRFDLSEVCGYGPYRVSTVEVALLKLAVVRQW